MATIDLVKIKLNGDTGGGKPATLESLSVSENGVYVPSEGVDGYNQVNVNVTTPTEVFVVPDSIKFAYSTFTEIPSYLDFSNMSDFSYMFSNCTKITTIPLLDTTKVTNMKYMFYYCTSLTTIPLLNTINVTDMYYMFRNCTSLTTIPQINTSNVTDMYGMFYGCTSLKSIPELDTSKVNSMEYMFFDCTSLQSLPLLDMGSVSSSNYLRNFFGYNDYINNLTNLGGFKNLKVSWNDSTGLYKTPNLTYQSVMNVINNLYDFRSNGDTTTRTIKFNPNSKALLSDADIAIATNKGWVIS